jgi:bifunctional non-homologous end joining protein LigD
MSLDKYHQKRKFDLTPEPEGEEHLSAPKALAFVVQEHHASQLHWDFRLEHEGVLASWAVPKGVPAEIGEKRLAVQVEDHPLEYGQFEGDIPEDQYGGGHVDIWDEGTFEVIKWDDKVVEVNISGAKMQGRYTLVKTKGYGKNSWILMKQKTKELIK